MQFIANKSTKNVRSRPATMQIICKLLKNGPGNTR